MPSEQRKAGCEAYRYRAVDVLDISLLHKNLLGLDTKLFHCRFRDDLALFELFYLSAMSIARIGKVETSRDALVEI